MKKSWEGFVSSRVQNDKVFTRASNGELLMPGLVYDIKVGDMRKVKITIESIGEEQEKDELQIYSMGTA